MIEMGSIVAIIPARSGSKRLPNKNLLPLAGKPLISWAIEAAITSCSLSKIVVSSDSHEILTVASAYPEVIPLKRADYLATDTASTLDVLLNVLDSMEAQCHGSKYVMLLQATSPLRTAQHIREVIEIIRSSGADSVISVCETEHSPLWCNVIGPNGEMDGFLPAELKNIRSQDLPKYYRLNGAIYIAEAAAFRKNHGFFMSNSKAYVMSQMDSVDIDTEIDLMLASLIIERRKRELNE